ncbi:hypothetical protein CIG2463D_1384 [Campylobacter iguaniorum]|uniref:hypothetical protein n=1 Tax=Campylobacter iguaniorum TaxID=1244531 RepID=UPI00073A1B9B|nr:hypothetical protein [Campylobacter iguaniorum]ALV24952.1 hypothetical protein CIG2463D_1384 [Campylobacter iguaniorum]
MKDLIIGSKQVAKGSNLSLNLATYQTHSTRAFNARGSKVAQVARIYPNIFIKNKFINFFLEIYIKSLLLFKNLKHLTTINALFDKVANHLNLCYQINLKYRFYGVLRGSKLKSNFATFATKKEKQWK